MDYTVTLSTEEEKALLSDMISINDWLDNAIHNKARKCIDTIVELHSNKQASKLTTQEKFTIVREAPVKSAAERQAEFEASQP